MNKHRRDIYDLSASTGETGLTGGTRERLTPEKRMPKKRKEIKILALSPPRKDPITNQDKKL